MRLLVLLLLLLPRLAFAATSIAFTSVPDNVRLVSAANTAPGGQVQLALVFNLAPGWHIYWQNPGDAGFPPRVTPTAPAQFGALAFPAPAWLVENGVGVNVLSGQAVLPFAARDVGNSVTASARWLVCKDVCIPQHADFTLALNGGPSAEAALFPPPMPPLPFTATVAPDGTLSVTGLGATQVKAAHVFPLGRDTLQAAAPQPLNFTASGFTLALPFAGPVPNAFQGVLEITDPSGTTQALTFTAPLSAAPGHPPYWALALLGGLVLNLMPCVFPILAMKAFAFARLGGAAHGHIRREALGYAAGVLGSMLALAALLLGLRAAGAEVFWGFQYQFPVFVGAAAAVMFAAALAMAGLFELPVPGFINRLPAQHSVLTGFLAVLVATPCTAPFMGTAIAAALALPAPDALGIFLALGLGLALPVLALAFFPGLAAALPRPGTWMIWLQRALALPLLATSAWLVWVLSRALLPQPPLTLPGATPYTTAALAAARASGQPVLVDLTAAWCVTCLVNETGTLESHAVQDALKAHGVQVLVGDWTNKDPAITALLTNNGRAGVPLYLYYRPGNAAPLVLPQLLTPGAVIAVVNAP